MKNRRYFFICNVFTFIISCLSTLLSLASCQQLTLEDEDEQENGKFSSVRIYTRAALSGDEVYPLHIYAFATNGSLCASQVVTSANDKVSLQLPRTSELRVVAVAANENVFNLPEKSVASAQITAKAPLLADDASDFAQQIAKGYVTSHPLQMAFADITPTAATATLSLQMHYQMAHLQIALNNIPDVCTSAYVTMASPHESISLGGEWNGSKKATIPLVRDDGTQQWKSGDVYVFPTTGNATNFTIVYNDAQGERFAQVCYQAPLNASTPYQLNGTLSADGLLSATGSVTAAKWGEPQSLQFTFTADVTTTIEKKDDGDTPKTDDDEDTSYKVTSIPAVGSLWQGHIVAAVKKYNDNSADLLLVSLDDFSNVTSALHATTPQMASELAQTYSEHDLANWRIPTDEEARQLREAYISATGDFDSCLQQAQGAAIVLTDDKGNNIRYLCADAQHTYSFKVGTSYNAIKNAGASIKNYHLRLVKTIKVNKSIN